MTCRRGRGRPGRCSGNRKDKPRVRARDARRQPTVLLNTARYKFLGKMMILIVFVGIGLAPQYALGITDSQQIPELSKALVSDLGAVFTSSRCQTFATISSKISVLTRTSIGLSFIPSSTENGSENR